MAENNLTIPIKIKLSAIDEIVKAFNGGRYEKEEIYNLRLLSESLRLRDDFDELLCLEQLPALEKLWYQIETVRKALKRFNGRVLLSDEVGLGKTIEAGMIMKEYRLRGLVDSILILAPASLVSQWQAEMKEKFGLDFKTPPASGAKDFARYWQKEKLLLCSMNLAKSAKVLPLVSARAYDLIVIDEAHHCKNKTSRNWQAVNALQKRFMLLLTATPVQNNLLELYNLITLLKPGQLSTEKFFKKNFVSGKDLKTPRHKEDLRVLLSEVMIRNTRSSVNIGLPKRWAHTFHAEPSPIELNLYEKISEFVRKYYGRGASGFDRLTLTVLQQEAGSSPAALIKTLHKLILRTKSDKGAAKKTAALSSLIKFAKSISGTAKASILVDIIKKRQDEKILVFTHFQETLSWLADFLRKNGIESVEFHGKLSADKKDEAIERFRSKTNVLLCTESGGEGKNMQFCNTLVNFDLPWNPMRIEQRIGRIHRFGQTREVFIFNLALKNSVEDYLLRILDEKINMFELVVGEIDMIVGKLEEERGLEDMIMDIWASNKNQAEQGFEDLGKRMIAAKEKYMQSKQLDRALFEKDYEV